MIKALGKTKSGHFSVAVPLTLLVALAVGGLEAQSRNDADAIRSVRAASNRAIAAHDVSAVVSVLDDDYVITDSTGHIGNGLPEQKVMWARHFADFKDVVYVRTPSKVSISGAYPHAMETGSWVGNRTTPEGKWEKGGEYSAVWRKINGVWKIHSEMFVALYCKGQGC